MQPLKMPGGGGIDQGYHERAQAFIKDSQAKGYSVRAEGDQIVAYPKGAPHSYTTPTRAPSGLDNVWNAGKAVVGAVVNSAKSIVGQDQMTKDTLNPNKPLLKSNKGYLGGN